METATGPMERKAEQTGQMERQAESNGDRKLVQAETNWSNGVQWRQPATGPVERQAEQTGQMERQAESNGDSSGDRDLPHAHTGICLTHTPSPSVGLTHTK